MREIKFRGYNRKNKQWLYGFYLQNRGAHFVCPDEFATGKEWDDYEVEPETVGQYTGLTDENGREIYEGDIVKVSYSGSVFVVTFDIGCFLADGIADKYLTDLNDFSDDCEVIGNIHDNPELITTKED